MAECTNDLAECTNKESAGISTLATWKDDVSQNRPFWRVQQAGISAKSGIDDLNGFERCCAMSMVQTTVGATWDVVASKKTIDGAGARECGSADWFVSGILGFVSVC